MLAPNFSNLRTTRAPGSVRVPPMPALTTSGNTVYTHPVAKVMISIPDDLLARLDGRARQIGETRSGFLQRLAERELAARGNREDEEIGHLLDSLDLDFGGRDIAQLIREDRESH
ncbi:MAG TPA: type II toxin-antitoxin system HicB family antitoxin [Solirubrobacterales bacterium]|nr:type II toxin-antitoxin system HicB family antitoxin [Solirubrobacterales bacterium]